MEKLSDSVVAISRFCLPPIADRVRYTWTNLPMALVTVFPLILAAHLRLRYPRTPLVVKAAVLMAGLPIITHLFLKRYFVGVWYASDGTPLSINHLNFLFGMATGVCALKLVEVLLLESDSEYEVRDAEEYRRSVGDKMNGNDGFYSLERPAIFPGSIVPLEIDMIGGVRGIGYNWGLKGSRSGYKAIIESQQLSLKPSSLASKEKWSHIRRLARVCLLCYLTMDVCDSFIKDPLMFPPGSRIGGGKVKEASKGLLGWLGPPLGERRWQGSYPQSSASC
jgi:hypothetical protein